MKILNKESGELLEAVIELVENEDWSIIHNNDAFQFDWLKERKQIVHKIRLEVEQEILGLISIEDIPREFRIHVRLIEVNSKDTGRNKRFDHIAGCLFAFTCQLAFEKDYEGFVSLQSKTELEEHYMNKYGFQQFGRNLFVELGQSQSLINKYLNDE
jgi:hypothetical protein